MMFDTPLNGRQTPRRRVLRVAMRDGAVVPDKNQQGRSGKVLFDVLLNGQLS